MIENMPLDDSWIAVDFVTEEEVPVMVRFRPNLQNFTEAGLYNQRMDIIWSYETANESLLPEIDDMDFMEGVENALVEILEQDNQSILAFTFTGENERWWAWYTTDINIAGERLNIALAQFNELPINISVTEDPEWAEYFGVLEDFSADE
ncbi:DUF695 domain-containing protein [Mucilaginibacter sp. SP1R1]|uniref:DUF695 domain-containing protein n=1 Tax=Mucilaginibacter sp. SP1R1 TaxID=2723091 RepID=UPI00160D1669|nr:DUF695 domain-containing protein [Mucilaginibacter sp. SP1R1]MBB6150529.1 hypothetical protein [Mucilaginibacter sp. SP1R1]